MRVEAILIVAFLVGACGAPKGATEDHGTWVGTITTEGNVTTVVNESGSVWGGRATLVEEASIGVESGDDAYMLGRVAGVFASEDEIFVIDGQVPVVRVYDMQGQHVRDFGQGGQGPGEFMYPHFITATPDGRILVLDVDNRRINVYGPGPEDVDSWPARIGQCCIHPMMMGRDGTLWIEGQIVNEQSLRPAEVLQAHGPDGPIGEPFAVPTFEYERWTFRYDGRELEGVPNAPSVVWTIHPDGPLVAGATDRYRFEILSLEGPRTVVEHFWEPVPITETEADFWRRNMQALFARTEEHGGNPPDWDGRMPAMKAAYRSLLASQSGETWVLREGPAQTTPDCEPGDPGDLAQAMLFSTGVRPPGACFTLSYLIDVFGPDGRYLGSVDGAMPDPTHYFIRDDMLITPMEDDAGTIMVKRYRLVLPGER